MRPPIYTFGDSHALHAWILIPGIHASSCGPMLMYMFGKYPAVYVKDLPKDAMAVFSWGEIDCRCHVNRHGPWKENVDGLVDGYVKAIRLNQEVHENIWIYLIPPPARKERTHDNASYPFFGTNEERRDYVLYMNDKLRSTGIPYIDVYEKVKDEDGFLSEKHSDMHVHIEDPKIITDWLDQKFGVENA
jgi:hypothetical protein